MSRPSWVAPVVTPGKLLEMEEKRTGRVKLANFYKAGLTGAWEFNEKVDYLQSLGVLDESVKDDPKVTWRLLVSFLW